MTTNSRTESILADEGRTFDAYVSVPENPNGSAIIVLQEIFGVTGTIRKVADHFAGDGFLAFAPDLFWRMQSGVQLGHSKEDMALAVRFLQRFDEAKAVLDIGRTVAHVRAQRGFGGAVAVVGMCLGGKLAYLAAARLDVDAAVGYYGVGIEKALEEAPNVKHPLLLHFGGQDKYAPPVAVAKIAAALADNPNVTIHTYPEADHGFYTRGDPAIINLAHERTARFLDQSLPAK